MQGYFKLSYLHQPHIRQTPGFGELYGIDATVLCAEIKIGVGEAFHTLSADFAQITNEAG